MANKTTIIAGIYGQDGTILSKKLLNRGDKIIGLIKKNSTPKITYPEIDIIETDDLSYKKIYNIIQKTKPDEIYNFLGVTNVINPWDNPHEVYEKNFIFPLSILESIKIISKKTRFLQSSSSLIFGETKKTIQNETDSKFPIYHYGFSKKFTDDLIKMYREKFGLFCCSAIFYNHESEFRGEHFFTKKLIRESCEITKGIKEFIELGNLNSYRDYGYAGDYMDACIKILEYYKPDDYIVSSNNKIKLFDLVTIVFNKLGLDINKHLVINEKLTRYDSLSNLCGDNSKIKSIGWSPKTTLDEMINIMIKHEKQK